MVKDDEVDSGRLTAKIPKSLRRTRKTVSGLLAKGGHRNQFKLEAVTSNFLKPLDDLLGKKKWLLSEQTSCLDALAIGYLALIRAPDVPNAWLRQALVEKYPSLDKWTERVSRECFGHHTALSDALVTPAPLGLRVNEHVLPWQSPTRPTPRDIGSTVLRNILDAVPVISQIRVNHQLKRASQNPQLDDCDGRKLSRLSTYQSKELYSQIGTVSTGVGALVVYLLWAGLLRWPKGLTSSTGKRDFGTAGAMLGLGLQ